MATRITVETENPITTHGIFQKQLFGLHEVASICNFLSVSEDHFLSETLDYEGVKNFVENLGNDSSLLNWDTFYD